MGINIFKIIGALGIILISIGKKKKKRKNQEIYYILGGFSLLIYSINLKDLIFIILQIIFIITSTYDLIKIKK